MLIMTYISFYSSANEFSQPQVNNLTKEQTTMSKQPTENVIATIRVIFNNQQLVVSLFDSEASKQLLAQLPLTLDFSDFANTEKIAYLPSKLNTHNTPTANESKGDFTYYQPWGNIAIFYKGFGSNSSLYVLGRIESGKEKIATMKQNFTATIEKID